MYAPFIPGTSTFPGVGDVAVRLPLGPAPATIDGTLSASHHAEAAWVIRGGPKDGTTLDVSSWSVSSRWDASPRRTVDLIAATPWAASEARAALDGRLGVEIVGTYYVRDGSGVEHSWPLGVFCLPRVQMVDKGAGVEVSVTAGDRSMRARRVTSWYSWGSHDETAEELIARFAGWFFPELPLQLTRTGKVLGQDYVAIQMGESAWDACVDVARTAGHELWVDQTGIVRMAPVQPLDETAPTASWVVPTQILGELTESWDSAEMVDGIIVTFTQPSSVEGQDGEQKSIPWPDYGRRHFSLYSGDTSMIHNDDEAGVLAKAELAKIAGREHSVSGSVWADPRREVGEVVTLSNPGSDLMVTARIASLTISGDSPWMSFTLTDRMVTHA